MRSESANSARNRQRVLASARLRLRIADCAIRNPQPAIGGGPVVQIVIANLASLTSILCRIMPSALASKWVLITGASSGFGAAAARAFARQGANLLLGARRRERLQTVAEEAGQAG